MSEPLLSIRGVHTYYGHIEALKRVDVDVHPAEPLFPGSTGWSRRDGGQSPTRAAPGVLLL